MLMAQRSLDQAPHTENRQPMTNRNEEILSEYFRQLEIRDPLEVPKCILEIVETVQEPRQPVDFAKLFDLCSPIRPSPE
jgi:DNA-binding protein Fis